MEHPVPNFHPTCDEKPGLLRGPGFDLRLRCSVFDQPRVRERIMKLSKVYSATCHHRYSSER
jgi:hypothetical protein